MPTEYSPIYCFPLLSRNSHVLGPIAVLGYLLAVVGYRSSGYLSPVDCPFLASFILLTPPSSPVYSVSSLALLGISFLYLLIPHHFSGLRSGFPLPFAMRVFGM